MSSPANSTNSTNSTTSTNSTMNSQDQHARHTVIVHSDDQQLPRTRVVVHAVIQATDTTETTKSSGSGGGVDGPVAAGPTHTQETIKAYYGSMYRALAFVEDHGNLPGLLWGTPAPAGDKKLAMELRLEVLVGMVGVEGKGRRRRRRKEVAAVGQR